MVCQCRLVGQTGAVDMSVAGAGVSARTGGSVAGIIIAAGAGVALGGSGVSVGIGGSVAGITVAVGWALLQPGSSVEATVIKMSTIKHLFVFISVLP
jgi:hypothetical protein